MKALAVLVHSINISILLAIGFVLYGCGGEGGSIGNDSASDSSSSSDVAGVARPTPTQSRDYTASTMAMSISATTIHVHLMRPRKSLPQRNRGQMARNITSQLASAVPSQL